MNRLAVTILFALCISQYCTRAAVISKTLTDIRQMKSEVETKLKVASEHTENYLFGLYENQDEAKNKFKTELDKEINAAVEEVKSAAQKQGNSAKANQCVVGAKKGLDNLYAIYPKIVEDCIESQHEDEVNGLFDKLIDEIDNGKKIRSLLESLEIDAQASNSRDYNVEKKFPGVRASIDLFRNVVDETAEKVDKMMKILLINFKECNDKQLVDVHSKTGVLKAHALECINQA